MIKEKLKSANFWVALISAVIMALRAFGIEMGGEEIETAISGLASVLLILGITVDPKAIADKIKAGVNTLSSKDTEVGKTDEGKTAVSASGTAIDNGKEASFENESQQNYKKQ